MPWVLIYKVVHFSYILSFGWSKNKMEHIANFHPLLSKCNNVIVVERSVQDILKTSLFWTSEVADACSTSVVSPYLLKAEKKFTSIINLSGLHRRHFILSAIAFWCRWRPCIVCKVCITHCFFITCSFILMKLTCDAILDLFLNLVSLVFFKLWLYSLLKMQNIENKHKEERKKNKRIMFNSKK